MSVTRRSFLAGGAAAAGVAAAFPVWGDTGRPVGGTKTKVLHLIGYSHIDAAWLWPWRDGSNLTLTTYRSALDRMKETPQFCFSESSSIHYQWAQRADPQMFAEIQQRVREGRWEVVGGWPVEPDCNIPAAESFVRHCLYGKNFCRRALGVDVNVGLNPDSFGHAAGLPIMLTHAGYKYYVFMRPDEQAMDLPLLFWWEAADGSRVLALRIWHSYDGGAQLIPQAAVAAFAPEFNDGAFFLGVGDHGGAVTKEQIRQILELQNDPNLPELRFSTLRDFFAAVERSPAFPALPVVKDELQHHARGCYSANGQVKFQNRRTERSLVQAETISCLAHEVAGLEYPGNEYATAWWKLCFVQFHDMLAGTSLFRDYENVRDSHGYGCETAQVNKIGALEVLARRVDLSTVEESAVFLLNLLPWRRRALMEYHVAQESEANRVTHLLSDKGEKIPLQWRPSDSMTGFFPRISAWVELPPCGYRVFQLARGEAPAGKPYGDFVEVSDSGFGISSLKAEDGTELLAGSIGLVAISDTSDTWAHGIDCFREEMGRPSLVSSLVVEDGPVTRVTRHRARWQNSEIVLDIAQFAGLDFVELRFVINWCEHEQMLKLEIPTALRQPVIYAKVPGQILERRTTGNEEPYQDWLAAQGVIGGNTYSVGLLNNSTYSYDCLNGLLRTVLVRSAPFARHNPWQVPHDNENAWQDQGRLERRFWLCGGRGAYSQLSLDRRSEELQTPAEYVIDSAHGGTEAWENSYFQVMPSNVWVLAIKRAESGDSTIVRIQERAGIATQATLKSSLFGLDHIVQLHPWELKTLSLRSRKGQSADLSEVTCLEV